MARVILHNGVVITPQRSLAGGLIMDDGRIVSVFDTAGDGFCPAPEDTVIDVNGQYITPGFIDIHTHGAGGADFMDGTVEAFLQGAETHLQYGTTTVVPTTLTSTMDELYRTLDLFREAKKASTHGPCLYGLHLEGPYFSMEQRGAQDPRYIKHPDRSEYMQVLDYSDDIVRWTLAPELPGALEMARVLKERGIIASIGHSDAIYEEVLDAVAAGFDLVTHLYSGMSGLKRIHGYRYAGVIETALLVDQLFVEVIADGHHLPESLLKLIYKNKGSDRICLVTDSMRAAGMPAGTYRLGSLTDGQEVLVEDGVAKLPDRTAFAGSVATANILLKTMVEVAGVSPQQAVTMLTATPAQVLGIQDHKGTLAPGKQGDVVVMDKNFQVTQVYVGGTQVVPAAQRS